jgi:hypothetical protein
MARRGDEWRHREMAPPLGHNSGMSPEQAAEAASYLKAAAPARGSPEHFKAIISSKMVKCSRQHSKSLRRHHPIA